MTLGRVVLFGITDRVCLISQLFGRIQRLRCTDWDYQRHLRLYPYRDSVGSTPSVTLFKPHLILQLPIGRLACPIRYCRCHLCLCHRLCSRPNVSPRYTPHHTCSSPSSCQWNSRMDVCLWSIGKCSYSVPYRYDG
jgi:hypothetical protein